MNPTNALESILHNFRTVSTSPREMGTYFEELCLLYFRNEPYYREQFKEVSTFKDWATSQKRDGRDTGIDLVAQTVTGEMVAIQCKFYDETYQIRKEDIDSFFTASGQKPFTHRIIVTTTNHWSEHAESSLQNQTPPVTKIDFYALLNSQIDWSKFSSGKKAVLKPKKTLRPHQKQAVKYVVEGLKEKDRGKLIMACGTGKTFTSLKITESITGKGKQVLFLVPSLALLSQSLTEWTQESDTPLHSFAVCSDVEIGKKRKKTDEIVETFAHELQYPATTEPDKLAREVKKIKDSEHITVIFSTYHSIEVLSLAQKKHGLPEFDFIICDEAHRTTGATFMGEEESHFVKVHDNSFLKSKKRLYMTATPRIYGEFAKASAEKENVALASMDDETIYGKELHVITFSEAVRQDLLVDYKVLVLAVDEAHINARLQKLLSENNQIKVDDAARIIGCWKALSKQGTSESLSDDFEPMRKAVAFCQVIEPNIGSRTHKISSKLIAKMFQEVVNAYQEKAPQADALHCEVKHVDGGMNATEKEDKIQWLKNSSDMNNCKILSNVRCLSEGVDVPALDAVLFLSPRNSQVDVVQSVGRVMRKSENKKRGYVILPVVIPAGVPPHEALNDNKTYKVVWQVLQALRSHDDRFDAMINKMEFTGADKSKMEVVAITDKLPKKSESRGEKEIKSGRGTQNLGSSSSSSKKDDLQPRLEFDIGEIEIAIYAKVVEKCGNRQHWEEWANDIAKIANTHISRIKTILAEKENTKEAKAFHDFVEELRDDLNESITQEEVIEMLAQHLITKPVFEALFSKYDFAKNNPVSEAMDKIIQILEKHNLSKETDTLNQFYASVKLRAEGIENASGKQKIILELYDKFFRNAFPRLTERLGIVYTPVEAVDFIIHSVNDLLKKEFGETLGSDSVHILDPFTGTGTFVTRLMQSGLLTKEELIRKYKTSLHANEIVLLAYYIACINIEAVYHDLTEEPYTPFTGICLTDTFQLYEKDDLISRMLVDNSSRRSKQKNLNIKVIICNPPYSSGQESANDNNQNVKYPYLDSRIEQTYVANTSAVLRNSLYNSYIRAIRWASDRIGESGIIGMITNAGFLEGNAMDGLRKCLQEEFDDIYVVHLRGNAYTSGEQRKKEKDNVFGQGSRTPVAICFFIKNNKSNKSSNIYFYDIGDYLSRDEKLSKLIELNSLNNIEINSLFKKLIPDKYYDWINQRSSETEDLIFLGDKNESLGLSLYNYKEYSSGINSNRDAWVYNSSRKRLFDNVNKLIKNYNKHIEIDTIIDTDSKNISWTENLKSLLKKKIKININNNNIRKMTYKPFYKQFVYFDKSLIERLLQIPKFFPNEDNGNILICILTGGGTKRDFTCLVTQDIPDRQYHYNSQCFPLYLYETSDDSDDTETTELLTQSKTPIRREAITDEGLSHFKEAYPNQKITKEDLFYYIYGILHSPMYREKYKDNLSKELPRIPRVKGFENFKISVDAGRKLAKIHLNYESAVTYPVTFKDSKTILKPEHYYVKQMKYKSKDDKSVLIYNEFITLEGIPLKAYEYIVNGKSALDWIVERYCVKTDKDSGITNDANDWGLETENNPKYPLELFQRITR